MSQPILDFTKALRDYRDHCSAIGHSDSEEYDRILDRQHRAVVAPLEARVAELKRVMWEGAENEKALLAEVSRLTAAHQTLRKELENIANADPRKWEGFEPKATDTDFRLWAQSRARHILRGPP